MPTPTRAEFDAAAKKVMATAPPGLSREQFYDLIDKEIAASHISQVSNAEPGDYRGGFIKGLKEYFSGGLKDLPSALEPLAHPKTAGDFGALLIPAEAGGALARDAVGRYGTALKTAYGDTHSVGGIATLPVRSYQALKDALPSANAAEVEKFMGRPPRRVGGPQATTPTRTVTQQPPTTVTPNTAGPSVFDRVTASRQKTANPLDVRITGKAPNLEEVLNEALTESMGQGEPARSASLPSTLDPSGGSLKQSGKFGKSQSMGQAGGYTSGRPGISDTRYDEMMQSAGGSTPLEPDTAPVSGGASPPAALDPAIVAEERRMYGSREAARRLGISRDEVLRLAPGPSQIPITAEERIREAARRAAAPADTHSGLEELLRSIIEGKEQP